jgi:CxxC motif-containing protein (DUF1111 family)
MTSDLQWPFQYRAHLSPPPQGEGGDKSAIALFPPLRAARGRVREGQQHLAQNHLTRPTLRRLVVTSTLFISLCCAVIQPAASHTAPVWLTTQLGGETTLNIANENAFAFPLSTLPTTELRKFTFGNRMFNTNWVVAPASVGALDGLGPLFNRVSCSSCHTRDGRGRPPEQAGEPLESMLIRLSIPGMNAQGGVQPVPHYGDQLNEKAITGVPAEGRTLVTYTAREGHYVDGARYSLVTPSYEFVALNYGPLPQDVQFSPRVATPMVGLGLLEAIADETLLALTDPNDANGDGISGRVNNVWDYLANKTVIGRFGWKANQPSLRQQNASAALGDIGITTRMFPAQNVMEGQYATATAPSGGSYNEPEMKDEFFERLTFYTQTLAVPAARHVDDPKMRAGAVQFETIGCSSCHVPTLKTGTHRDVPQLSNQIIHPFTDLLLHDMGDELADGRADFEATGREWRTSPLWGIGLTETVNRHTRFLHDGRARSLEEAVLWHGGEASKARDRFMHLNKAQRAALLMFLENI